MLQRFSLKSISKSLICILVGLLVGYLCAPKKVVCTVEPTSDLLKTVAHVDLSSRDDLVQVYNDANNDIAYYMYTGDRAIVKIGDTVTGINNIVGTITEVDAYGFRFKTDSFIENGMSSSGIFDTEGNQIGILSTVEDDGSVYCIWI